MDNLKIKTSLPQMLFTWGLGNFLVCSLIFLP
jgi:hypothetical protein